MVSYIYIIGSDEPPYKIGISKNPEKRLKELLNELKKNKNSVLFIDEIHRYSKTQQADAAVADGSEARGGEGVDPWGDACGCRGEAA